MTITLTELLIWLIIAAIVGFIGEALAGRRGPGGLVGAILIGFLAIFLVVGVFHFSISGEPFLDGVPLISSILAAILLVLHLELHSLSARCHLLSALLRPSSSAFPISLVNRNM